MLCGAACRLGDSVWCDNDPAPAGKLPRGSPVRCHCRNLSYHEADCRRKPYWLHRACAEFLARGWGKVPTAAISPVSSPAAAQPWGQPQQAQQQAHAPHLMSPQASGSGQATMAGASPGSSQSQQQQVLGSPATPRSVGRGSQQQAAAAASSGGQRQGTPSTPATAAGTWSMRLLPSNDDHKPLLGRPCAHCQLPFRWVLFACALENSLRAYLSTSALLSTSAVFVRTHTYQTTLATRC